MSTIAMTQMILRIKMLTNTRTHGHQINQLNQVVNPEAIIAVIRNRSCHCQKVPVQKASAAHDPPPAAQRQKKPKTEKMISHRVSITIEI